LRKKAETYGAVPETKEFDILVVTPIFPSYPPLLYPTKDSPIDS